MSEHVSMPGEEGSEPLLTNQADHLSTFGEITGKALRTGINSSFGQKNNPHRHVFLKSVSVIPKVIGTFLSIEHQLKKNYKSVWS